MKRFYYALIISLALMLTPLAGAMAEEGSLPASYDLRDVDGHSYVTGVKYQNPWGTCWSFASNAAAESNALLKGAPADIDLSERSLAWFATRLQKNPGAPDSTYEGYYTMSTEGLPQGVDMEAFAALNNGGCAEYSINQLATWYGSSTEAKAPYTNDENEMENGEPAMQGTWGLPYNMLYDGQIHLQNAEQCYSSIVATEDGIIYNTEPETFAAGMKQAILDHGAVMISYGVVQDRFIEDQFYNQETSAYYNFDCSKAGPNHAVTVVGWDDSYPASNFATTPPGDGAYIVKNSWSTRWGEEGYFYLSYYDQSIKAYTWMDVETPDVEGGYSYDNIYQYDLLGAKYPPLYMEMLPLMDDSGIAPGELSFASVFTADHSETLRAVSVFDPQDSFFVPSTTSTDIEVYLLNEGHSSPTDGELVATATHTSSHYGFHTVELDTPVSLSAGTSFAVVETQTTTAVNTEGVERTLPMLSVEFGLQKPVTTDLQDPGGNYIGTSLSALRARAQAGQSFIKGLNGEAWEDVTSEAVANSDKINITLDAGTEEENSTVVGNAMIKAYTTDDEAVTPPPSKPEVERINLTPDEVILSTVPGGENSVTIEASFEPEGAYLDVDNFRWAATESVLDMQVDPSNLSVTVTAKSEGYGVVSCSNGAQFGLALVWVSDQPVIADSIEAENNSPDSFDVTVGNVRDNPAVPGEVTPDGVSIFCWSEVNQLDINAKLVSRTDGEVDYVLEGVPVNDNAINNYFLRADDIIINAYADCGGHAYWLGSGNVSWVDGEMMNPLTLGPNSLEMLTYITYGQNVGFVRPSVFNPATSGVLGIDNSRHLEGVRVSSNVQGMAVSTQVYVPGIGWLQGDDGDYVGTMGDDLPIEAINLDLEGPYEYQMGGTLIYRAYIAGQGWTDWVRKGTQVGNPDSGNPILAIELNVSQDR